MLITLTTDFGLSDPYVGIMKGVILTRAPQVKLVDLSHHIPPQAILAGSQVLTAARPFFPAGTIHLAVVDPGVGSSRRLICLQCDGQLFLAPDNGLLTPFFYEPAQAFVLENNDLFLSPLATTFHGRDILAPVAAALANGLPITQVGPSCLLSSLKKLSPPSPKISSTAITGQIEYIDHFGNAITNITTQHLQQANFAPASVVVQVADLPTLALQSTYSGAPPGTAISLINSNNILEIAVVNGNAYQQLRLSLGSSIKILKNSY